MLVEQDTDMMPNACNLPPELQTSAIILGQEPAWRTRDVGEVIAWLAHHNLAVVGVEHWQEVQGFPKWIASSNYNYEPIVVWKEYVHHCAEGAVAFVERFGAERDALFNLTWIGEQETV